MERIDLYLDYIQACRDATLLKEDEWLTLDVSLECPLSQGFGMSAAGLVAVGRAVHVQLRRRGLHDLAPQPLVLVLLARRAAERSLELDHALRHRVELLRVLLERKARSLAPRHPRRALVRREEWRSGQGCGQVGRY